MRYIPGVSNASVGVSWRITKTKHQKRIDVKACQEMGFNRYGYLVQLPVLGCIWCIGSDYKTRTPARYILSGQPFFCTSLYAYHGIIVRTASCSTPYARWEASYLLTVEINTHTYIHTRARILMTGMMGDGRPVPVSSLIYQIFE